MNDFRKENLNDTEITVVYGIFLCKPLLEWMRLHHDH